MTWVLFHEEKNINALRCQGLVMTTFCMIITLGSQEVFSPGGVAYVVAFVFHAPGLSYVGVQVGGAGSVGWRVGEGQGEFFAGGGLKWVKW